MNKTKKIIAIALVFLVLTTALWARNGSFRGSRYGLSSQGSWGNSRRIDAIFYNADTDSTIAAEDLLESDKEALTHMYELLSKHRNEASGALTIESDRYLDAYYFSVSRALDFHNEILEYFEIVPASLTPDSSAPTTIEEAYRMIAQNSESGINAVEDAVTAGLQEALRPYFAMREMQFLAHLEQSVYNLTLAGEQDLDQNWLDIVKGDVSLLVSTTDWHANIGNRFLGKKNFASKNFGRRNFRDFDGSGYRDFDGRGYRDFDGRGYRNFDGSGYRDFDGRGYRDFDGRGYRDFDGSRNWDYEEADQD